MAVAGVGLAVLRAADDLDEYGPNVLPAFDAYVYAAMAEHPRVFTLPPWGYRLLPALVAHAVPLPPAVASSILTPVLLAVAAVLLFAWLRRLGHGVLAGILGAAAFAFSPPVAHAVGYSVLAEPLAVTLEVAFLVALAAGMPAGVLALMLVLGVAAKELLLVLLAPLVFTVAVGRLGWRTALARTVAIALPAVAWLVLVRWRWPAAPDDGHLANPAAGLRLLVAGVAEWGVPLLLGGVLPLAVAATRRAEARVFLRSWGVLLLPGMAVPFAAGLYVPGSGGAPAFFAADVERLLIYPLPVLIALAAHLLGPPHPEPPPARPTPVWAWVLTASLCATPLLLDTYRRHDLSGPRDGPRVLALCRGTLATASRLAAGRPVIWRFPDHGYQPVRMAPEYLDRTRWFLLDGWGPRPHFGLQPVTMQDDRATVLLPVTDTSRGLDVVMALRLQAPLVLAVTVNGQAVHHAALPAGESRPGWHVPGTVLFRGDNIMAIAATGATARLTVDRIGLHPRPGLP